MGLLIEDISGNELPSGSADLFHRFYTAAAQHTEAQPLLEELVCMLKDFSRCDSVKILIMDQPRTQLLRAESGSKPGLWDKDHSLSAEVINSFFVKKNDKSDSLYTPGGSLYLNDVNALEGMLRNKLKELVVNTCNSYGFNSLALIPVKLGDSICGFIQLANKNRDIAEDTIATVENISELLQIIFERVALKREIRTQRESLLKQMHGRGAHLEALSERLKQEAAERKKAQEELQIRKNLVVALASVEKIEDALQLCLDTAIRVSGMDSGGIYILDTATSVLDLACWRGLSDSFTAQVSHFDASESNTGLVLEGQSLYSPEGIKTQDEALLQPEGIKGLAVVPVMHQGKVIASLNIMSHVFEVVPGTARSVLEAVAAEIGSAIARIRDREALAESQGRYGILFAQSKNPVLVIDEAGNYIEGNEAALSFLECTPEELLRMNVRDTLPPYLDDEWLTGYRKIWETGGRVERDYYVWGKIKVLELTITPLKIGSRKVVIGIGTDITERKKAEIALIESESKYRSLVESGGAGIAVVDMEGKITFSNDTLCRMAGYFREELLGKKFLDFVHPEDRDRDAQLFLEALGQDKTGIHLETRVLHKGGHIIWLYTSPVELKINDKIVGFSVIVQDITEHKRAEETIRQNEEKYGTILEEIDEHYAEIDARGNFTFINEAMCRYFGYSKEEMIGMNYKTYTPPESLKQRLEVFSEVFKTGKPKYWQLFEDIVKDGSRRLVEISIFPLKDSKGEIVGLRSIGRDVTDRKQAELDLKESEERYRLLAENSLDVIFTTDMNTQLAYISPSVRYLTGLGAEEILIMLRQNRLTAESLGISLRDGHRFQQSLKALAEDPSRTEVFEFALKHREGYINWAEVQMSIMRDKFGQAAGILGIIRDISQQKKMTERLVSADRLASLGEMAAGLAHEVNNPLTAVMGFSYLLTQNPDTPADVRNDVDAIYREGKRAAEIIRNFLTFARGQKPEKQAIYINDILEEVLKLRHNQMEKENIQVNLSLWEDLPAIQGDISQIQQVFLNIILNAEYFMYRTNKRGTLTVNTKLTDGKVIVVIRDDGPGIASEAISRIFDPFYTTKDVGEGTGLGLSICHGIVMEHGGTIFAESEPGQGAALTVELPVR